MTSPDPHGRGTLVRIGPPARTARLVVLGVHGRNADPAAILNLAPAVSAPDVSWVAPTAADRTWYPHPFIAPIVENEPWLGSALRVLERTVRTLADEGVPTQRIVLLGFSQGACLAGEYAVRHAGRYGGVIMLSGGLIGPPGTGWDWPGDFEGTPIFLGCSDVDSHIPKERVNESAEVFRSMGATADARLYPHMGHAINGDELEAVRAML